MTENEKKELEIEKNEQVPPEPETAEINSEPNPVFETRNMEPTQEPDAVPEEVKGWNWGAFAFNIFWGIGNKTYLPLLCLIPIFNIGWIFVCGAKGNEWAWKSGSYASVEEFKTVQASWKRAGLVQAILMAVGAVLGVLMVILMAIYGAAIGYYINDQYGDDYGYYNNYSYDDDYSFFSDDSSDYYDTDNSASITDIPNWTQEIYSSITLATETIDPETNVATYKDGTSFEDLVELVGEPEDTVRDGNTMTVTWWSDDYDYIDIDYDIPSGLIIDKYNSL